MNEEYWSLRDCQEKIKELEKRVAQLENPFSNMVERVFEQMTWVDEDGNPTTAEEIFKKREAKK